MDSSLQILTSMLVNFVDAYNYFANPLILNPISEF